MPVCCTPYIETGNSALIDVQYTDTMRQTFGDVPRIELLFLNEEGNYVAAGIFTQIQFNGTNILGDNGGPAKWLIKVS